MSTVQATVRRWVPGEGGSALTDQGHELALPAECLVGSVFRSLRLGQRLRLELVEGAVVRVDLP